MVIRIHLPAQLKLSKVVHTLSCATRLLGAAEHRQEQGGQHANDRDDHQ
jgi:hypothetical protein